jgi:hypothetical protein
MRPPAAIRFLAIGIRTDRDGRFAFSVHEGRRYRVRATHNSHLDSGRVVQLLGELGRIDASVGEVTVVVRSHHGR